MEKSLSSWEGGKTGQGSHSGFLLSLILKDAQMITRMRRSISGVRNSSPQAMEVQGVSGGGDCLELLEPSVMEMGPAMVGCRGEGASSHPHE